MTSNENATAARYAVVYARGAAHIKGLPERVTTGMDSLNYARSACPTLTKTIFWSFALRTNDLAEATKCAVDLARSGSAKGVCKKCLKTALAVLETEAREMHSEWEAEQTAAVNTAAATLEAWDSRAREWQFVRSLGQLTLEQARREFRASCHTETADYLRVTCPEGVLIGHLGDPTDSESFHPDPR